MFLKDFPQGFILCPTIFMQYINYLGDDVVFNIFICTDDTTLYSKCDRASDLWQQLELASELESDQWDIVDRGRNWLIDFNAGKIQLISSDRSNNTGSIDVKMNEPVLERKSSFKMLGLTFSSKLDWGLLHYLYCQKCLQKNWSLDSFHEFSFSLRLLCSSINLPYDHAWNTVVILGLVLLGVTCNCWISYKNGYAGLLVLHLLPLMNPWHIVEM